jgi:hypothetical protein
LKFQSGSAAVDGLADAQRAIRHMAHGQTLAQSATRVKRAILNKLIEAQ